jgi:hypothetical protein
VVRAPVKIAGYGRFALGEGIEKKFDTPLKPGETRSLRVDLPAGTYMVTTTRQIEGSPLIQAGAWTFLPGQTYGVCFFIYR